MYHFRGWNSYLMQCWYPFPVYKANIQCTKERKWHRKCSNTFHFHGGENETISDEMRWIPNSFRSFKTEKIRWRWKDVLAKRRIGLPIKIGFFPFNIDSIEWIQTKPGGECESGLVRPFGQWWEDYGWAFDTRKTKENVRSWSHGHLFEHIH